MIITVISKIFGFVRESVMAAYIGAGELKSVYTTATTIPVLFINVMVLAISSGFIPTYNKVLNEKDRSEADKFTSNLINVLLIIGGVFLLLVVIFARQLSILLSPKLEGYWLDLATTFTRISVLGIFGIIYSSVIRGYLNIYGNFIDPALTGIFLNLIIIVSTILTSKFSIPYILIVGTVIANVIQYIRFPQASKKLGFRYEKILNLDDKYIRYILMLSMPIMISTATDSISLIIDNSMASAFFGVASVSKIFYAKSMLNFILTVVTISISTVTYPDIAKAGQSGNIELMKSKIRDANIFSLLLVIPATFGMMVLSKPIIQLAFERNAFTIKDTNIVSSLLVCYGPYIIFTSIFKIFQNGFYSVGDAKTPLIIVLILQSTNIILNIILSKIFGIHGLAYATSIATALGSVLLILMYKNKYGSGGNISTVVSLLKILFAAIAMSFVAKYLFVSLNISLLVSLLITVMLSGIIYIIILMILRVNELKKLVELFTNKTK